MQINFTIDLYSYHLKVYNEKIQFGKKITAMLEGFTKRDDVYIEGKDNFLQLGFA